tara:strand:+ start:1770 stop:2357 length:588 start_codon:yes stop_codon:yes gene_type:complete
MKNYFCKEFHADSYLMYDYLSQLEMYTGNERSGQKFFTKEKGSKKPNSFKFGWTWRKRRGTGEREYCPIKKMYKSKAMEDNPWLLDMFKEYSNNYFPTFEWTEIQINHMPEGCRTKQHLDKVNVGDSILIAFGDYKGGLTYVKNKNDRNYEIHDARFEPIQFNGAERLHGVTTITSGDRFSLVFYKNKERQIEPY